MSALPRTDATDRPDEALRLALLNRWQRDFPIVDEPFERIGARLGIPGSQVIQAYRSLLGEGALSRIGAVFSTGAGGSAMLCAMAVAGADLERAARIVSAHPGVNHNYEREHHHNLWFVITGCDSPQIHADVDDLEQRTGCPALRLPMQRAYRIDLGFDLEGRAAFDAFHAPVPRPVMPVAPADRALASLLEDGLPLVPRPYDVWASRLRRTRADVKDTLQRWLDHGTLRRFGVVVRHHEVGFAANAMNVFDVPDDEVDARGQALAQCQGVTLAYRRARAGGWPFNLYCMVHGRDRVSVQQAIAAAVQRAGLAAHRHEVLFSTRRFKQTGARYFRDATVAAGHGRA